MVEGTYTLTSGFGPRSGTMHNGVDFAAPLKTKIYAAEDGVVVDSRSGVSGFGCWIIIDHSINGEKVSTVYGHMYPDGLLVKKGDKVVAGQLIAEVGNNGDTTGPHCHFEVWPGGRLTGGKPVDPMIWLVKDVAQEPPLGYDDWCCK